MTKNPFYNALFALIYIIAIVFLIYFVGQTETNEGVTQFVMPIVMLSLFTLSAAVMGYIFCFQPLKLFLENKKEEAVKLFLKTVGIFASIIVFFVIIYLLIFYQVIIIS